MTSATTGLSFQTYPWQEWQSPDQPHTLEQAARYAVLDMLGGLGANLDADAAYRARVLSAVVAHAQEHVGWAVDDMRKNGSSWGEIGQALGMSRQAAHQRFSR